MNGRSLSSLTFAATALLTVTVHAQGSTFIGRVLSDSGVALAGAEVVLNGPQNTQRTNAQGEFRFSAIPAGEHIVGVRMPGYAPKVDTIEVADAGEVRREFKLARIEATLPLVPVTASMRATVGAQRQSGWTASTSELTTT